MTKIARNAPCPCGSGKKYKKCCLKKDQEAEREKQAELRVPYEPAVIYDGEDDLDDLSNRANDLIREGRFDEAEEAIREIERQYPGIIDVIDRTAQLLEAKGENKAAAEYYRRAADYARNNPGFEDASIAYYVELAERLDPQSTVED